MIRYKIITLLMGLGLVLSSCEEWLDISPKTEIKADDNFENEQGYKDALTGVYLLLTDGSLYGRELTFGFTDVLAQYYTGIQNTSHTYYYPSSYDYTNDNSISVINNIWSGMYNAIANNNELIRQLDGDVENLFTGRNYSLIKGEAYGLRAFMHFDLVRLFGPSYLANPDANAIPYINTISTSITPLSTVEGVLNLALADLKIAEEYLSEDPVIAENATESTIDETYERDRFYKFNYYACKLLEARIYLYKQDYVNANAAAQAIINQDTFYWTPESEITSSDDDSRNYVLSEELIFALYDGNLSSSYSSYFTGKDGLYMLETNYEGLFELNKAGYYGDYRYTYLTNLLSDVDLRFSSKLKQPSGGNGSYLYRMPLMRISEAYYIAAECAVANDDLEGAINYLTTVRVKRNLPDDLSLTLTKEDVQEEVYKEYVKEMMCEGQLFYYFKRLDQEYVKIPVMSGGSRSYTYVSPQYILPLPDDELEYGGRNNE